MLASDDNNPAFYGARNPDNVLNVQFFSMPIKNEFKSTEAGRAIFDSCECVKIVTPGKTDNIPVQFVNDSHKERFPLQWQAYKNRVGNVVQITGTPLSEWPRLAVGQVRELEHLEFKTVEAIASASDAQLQGIGMVAGTSIFAFRDEAKNFLATTAAAAKLSEADKRVIEANTEIATIKADAEARIKKMEEAQALQADQTAKLLEQLSAMMAKQADPQPAPRGRPPLDKRDDKAA